MHTISIPCSLARTQLAWGGLVAMWILGGCQLGEADVVRRTPELGGGTGGNTGLDAPPVDNATADTAAPSAFRLDGGTTLDAPENHEARPEAATSSDAAIDKNREEYDTTKGPLDAITRSDVVFPCGAVGDVFCDTFESGAESWVATGGAWDTIPESPDSPDSIDGSVPNFVFGPTNAMASIASVPSGSWRNMTVEAKVMVTSLKNASAANRVVLYARFQDITHFYGVALRGDGKLDLRRNANVFGISANVSIAEGEWHTLQIKVSGPADNVVVEGSLDGVLLATATDTTGSLATDTGTVGVGVYGGTLAVFDDVKVSSP